MSNEDAAQFTPEELAELAIIELPLRIPYDPFITLEPRNKDFVPIMEAFAETGLAVWTKDWGNDSFVDYLYSAPVWSAEESSAKCMTPPCWRDRTGLTESASVGETLVIVRSE
jgi:hypothetical protein